MSLPHRVASIVGVQHTIGGNTRQLRASTRDLRLTNVARRQGGGQTHAVPVGWHSTCWTRGSHLGPRRAGDRHLPLDRLEGPEVDGALAGRRAARAYEANDEDDVEHREGAELDAVHVERGDRNEVGERGRQEYH